MNQVATQPSDYRGLDEIKALVLDGVSSQHSRRAYDRALTDFFAWFQMQGRRKLTKAIVQAYKVKLQDDGLAPATINQRVSAIRKLAREAADNGLMDPVLANGIANVEGVTAGGRRSGNWLTQEQAQALLDAPDTSTLKGLRDRAILAVLLGSALRRSEAAGLKVDDIQQRDGRWAIVDIVGKRNKVRTIPIPSWVKAAIDAWVDVAGLYEGRVFRAIDKGGRVWGEGVSTQAFWKVVETYAKALGFKVAPHDLRRTFAKLAHKGGSPIDQIQMTLGHASIQTTERYLGVEQDMTDAPADRLGLRLK